MKKTGFVIFLVSIIFSILLINTKATATSWVEMEPEEVLDLAEVIVMGTYEFTG